MECRACRQDLAGVHAMRQIGYGSDKELVRRAGRQCNVGRGYLAHRWAGRDGGPGNTGRAW